MIKTDTIAHVERHVGWSGAGCHGYQALRVGRVADAHETGPQTIEVPGWELPPGSEVEVTISVRVLKLGRESRKRCENPWPAHRCPDGTYPNRKRSKS